MSNLIWPGKVKGFTYSSVKTSDFDTLEQDAPNGYTLRIAQRNNPIWHWQLQYGYLYDTYLSPQNTQDNAPYTDLQTLLGFIVAMKGKAGDFLYPDPEDYCAGGLRSGIWQPNRQYPLGAVILDLRGNAQLVTAPGVSGPGPFPPAFSNVLNAATPDGSITWTNQGLFPNGWPNAPVSLPLVTDGLGNYYSPLQRDLGGYAVEDVTDLVPNTLQVYAAGAPINSYQVLGPGLGVPGASYMGLYLQWGSVPPRPITATFQFYFRVGFEDDTQDFERWAKGLSAIGGNNAQLGSGVLKLKSSRLAVV